MHSYTQWAMRCWLMTRASEWQEALPRQQGLTQHNPTPKRWKSPAWKKPFDFFPPVVQTDTLGHNSLNIDFQMKINITTEVQSQQIRIPGCLCHWASSKRAKSFRTNNCGMISTALTPECWGSWTFTHMEFCPRNSLFLLILSFLTESAICLTKGRLYDVFFIICDINILDK